MAEQSLKKGFSSFGAVAKVGVGEFESRNGAEKTFVFVGAFFGASILIANQIFYGNAKRTSSNESILLVLREREDAQQQ